MADIKVEIQTLAKSLEFKLDANEIEKIEVEYLSIIDNLNLIKNIDVKNVEPTHFVHNINNAGILRKDIVRDYNQKDVFSNCKLLITNCVVVKNEK